MKSSIIFLIIGMMLVTYIPRLIPFLILKKDNFSQKLEKFLSIIPYTALGALIFPGVLSAVPDMPAASLLGIAFAFVYVWFRGGIVIPVLGSILIVFILLYLDSGMIYF
jgi:branched-subunit amino acid transport protein